MILKNNKDINVSSSSINHTLRDVKDGNVYRHLKSLCTDPFLTLTINIDGIEIRKGLNRSIWPVLLVINEIPLKERYALENVIFAGIWSGPNKPSRSQMQSVLKPIVSELSLLENGTIFADYSKESHGSKIIRVFLTSACADKPAQALLQNLPEPTAAFGCSRCEIEGVTILLFNSIFF